MSAIFYRRLINERKNFLLIFLTLFIQSCHPVNQKEIDNFNIYGKWVIDDVRILREKTIPADEPAPKLHDKNYIGKTINIARDKITTDLTENDSTEGIDCIKPVFAANEQYFSQLLRDTITERNFPYGSPGYPDAPTPAVYQLQSLTAHPVKVITVICGQGEFGNPADYGMNPLPLRMNWLVRIDDRHIALHWYVDSILILRRAG